MPTAGQIIRAVDFPESKSVDQGADEIGFASTTYAPGASACGVTFIAPTSGRVQVSWFARYESNSTNFTFISAAVRTGGVIGSGTSVAVASDGVAIETAAGTDVNQQYPMYRMVTGLSAGSTYNAQIEMKVSANTSDIFDRNITVIPLP